MRENSGIAGGGCRPQPMGGGIARSYGNMLPTGAGLHRDFPNSFDYGGVSLDFALASGPPCGLELPWIQSWQSL
jgi:hypothetical protein